MGSTWLVPLVRPDSLAHWFTDHPCDQSFGANDRARCGHAPGRGGMQHRGDTLPGVTLCPECELAWRIAFWPGVEQHVV